MGEVSRRISMALVSWSNGCCLDVVVLHALNISQEASEFKWTAASRFVDIARRNDLSLRDNLRATFLARHFA